MSLPEHGFNILARYSVR